MDLRYDRKTGDVEMTVTPDEATFLSPLMQIVLEEEARGGADVPQLGKKFFDDFFRTSKKFSIPFGFKYTGFVITFLNEAIAGHADELGSQVIEIERFINALDKNCPHGEILH